MKKYLLLTLGVTAFLFYGLTGKEKEDVSFDIRIVAGGLSDPWAVSCSADGTLWVTESKGYRVLKIDPLNGKSTVVLDLSKDRQFPSFAELRSRQQPVPQGGLMGLALHPAFSSGQPYVYLAYVYKYIQDNRFLLKIARYKYNRETGLLADPLILSDTIPAGNDHNGGRMMIAPVGAKPYLFYTVGDMGSGQFTNGAVPNKAQLINSYEGKILRFNLEPDSAGGINWIPADNPVLAGKRTAVWTTGHRNPQGLAWAAIGNEQRIYAAEHGPYSDDEINLIEKGMNYGHPLIVGYTDGNYDGLAASVSDRHELPGDWNTSYPLIKSERENAAALGPHYRDPVMSFNPTSNTVLTALFNMIRQNRKAEWTSVAPSGIATYTSGAIPGWKHSLLVTSLKTGKLIRLKLKDNGTVDQTTIYQYAPSIARYRDVTVSADGEKIYLATDSSAITSGPTAENPKTTSQRGCILELKYRRN